MFSAAHESVATATLPRDTVSLPRTQGQMSCVAQDQQEVALLALEKIIAEGKAIIDGGATSSLASEEALATVARMNWESRGDE